MRVNLAHIHERTTTGHELDFAVFDANARTGLDSDRDDLLSDLTVSARRAGLKVDVSALAYEENGQIRFYGDKVVVEFLSRMGVPNWNKWIEV